MTSLRLCFLALFPVLLFGQTPSEFEAQVFENAAGESLPYRILYPLHYDQTQSYPVILFLHGSGERGEDNEKQLVHGADMFLDEANRTRFPAFVVVPQCPSGDSWNTMSSKRGKNGRKRTGKYGTEATGPLQNVLALLDELNNSLPIDENRIYLGGLSMGGMGAFELLAREGDRFAAAFPICGGGYPNTVKEYPKAIAMWIFHGADDSVVPAQWSRDMHAALQKAGINSTYTEYPGVNHNSWDNVFVEPELFSWLFSHRKN
ncbi:MAG: dienelactone hydrolase family protein [Bacteroidota bacterium]